MKERVEKRKEISGWEEERKAFFEGRGVRLEEVLEEGEEIGEWFAGLVGSDL